MCRVYSDMWLQVRRDRIARDIVFAHSVYFGVCCCTHFPFHLLSERRPFHHLFSLFLVQHLSISPLLFIPLLGCACKFGRVHRSCCNSLKVLWLFFFSSLSLDLETHCCSEACLSLARRLFFKRNITSTLRIELVPKRLRFFTST